MSGLLNRFLAGIVLFISFTPISFSQIDQAPATEINLGVEVCKCSSELLSLAKEFNKAREKEDGKAIMHLRMQVKPVREKFLSCVKGLAEKVPTERFKNLDTELRKSCPEWFNVGK